MFAISKNGAALSSEALIKIIARRSRACTIECPRPRRKRHRDHGHQGSGVDYRPRNWAGNRHQANRQRAAQVLDSCRPAILDHALPRAVAATPGDSVLLGNFPAEYLHASTSAMPRVPGG